MHNKNRCAINLDMNGRDHKDDIDLHCFSVLLNMELGVNAVVRTRWNNDTLVEPRYGTRTSARALRRCLNIPEGFTGYISFSFHNSRLSGPPWVEKDGGRYIQLR